MNITAEPSYIRADGKVSKYIQSWNGLIDGKVVVENCYPKQAAIEEAKKVAAQRGGS